MTSYSRQYEAAGEPMTSFIAQYEITDQDQPLSALAEEARQRMTEDVLQLGLILGPISDPVLLDIAGAPWLQLTGDVRDAGALLESVGIRA